MAEQRSDDENETIDRCVKELDNSGGDEITGSKVGREEGLKASFNVPKFGDWIDSSSSVVGDFANGGRVVGATVTEAGKGFCRG
ncbi:hypothetical protein E3N88_20577 [Mikania micrantha]|uniref:Uncharacterized protein n=1 Tax=Mikania micrantha TaxID=192012 RepID=A0A5N6NHT6_9ASTR|nr:hypothetical protein E3N88_20577 [Mikania micrantha]